MIYLLTDTHLYVTNRISNKDRIYLSGYFGDDIFALDFIGSGSNELEAEEFDFGLGWGNKTAALRWNHLFHDKLFSNITTKVS